MNFLFCIFLLYVTHKTVESHAHYEVKEAENLFRRLFKLRRVEQLAAVKRIRSLDSEEKQKKMIMTAAEKIFSMLQNNRIILETAGFVPGVSSFPEDEDIRDALSNLLENTALIGDIILRLPEISQSLLSSHNNWVILLSWSLQFANQTDLLDQQTVTLIDLVSQEMNFTARSDNYINPYKYSYRSEKEQEENEIKPLKPKKKNKTKDSRRGPRLSSRGNGEL